MHRWWIKVDKPETDRSCLAPEKKPALDQKLPLSVGTTLQHKCGMVVCIWCVFGEFWGPMCLYSDLTLF